MLLVKYSFDFTHNRVHIFPTVVGSMYIFPPAPMLNLGGGGGGGGGGGEKLTLGN